MQAQIPPQVFYAHVEKISQTWANKFVDEFDSIILVNGKATPENEKTVAIVSWLFAAYNLTDTIICVAQNKMIIFTSQRKIKFLEAVKDHANAQKFDVSFVQKVDDNKENFKKIWQLLHGNKEKPKIGIIVKDSKTGPVAEDFQNYLKQEIYEPIEISHFFNECFLTKSKDEIENMKKSSIVTSYFIAKFIKEIQEVIDDGNNVKHNDLTSKMQKLLSNEGQLKKCSLKCAKNHETLPINKQYIDIGPAINVQSGGSYNPQLFTESNSNTLHYDCILLGLGTLYKSYNSYVARTLLINPTQAQKTYYKKIVGLCKIIQQNLRPGQSIENIYKRAAQFVKEQLPDCDVPKSFGNGIGIFLYESSLQICENNKKVVEPGFCFLVNCTFTNLKYETKKGTKTFAIQVVDTVVVSDKGQQVLTSDASVSISSISYELGQDDEHQKKKSKNPNIIVSDNNDGRPVTRRRGRNTQTTVDKLKTQKVRIEHQMDLKRKKLEQLKERVHQNFIGGFKKQKNIQCWKLQTYKSREQLPREMKKNQIYVDFKNNAILLPINGRHVPFHIHTLKNVVKNDEGRFASLRFNFHLPGTIANIIFPKYTQPCVYVKEMVFRSQQVARIGDLEKQIKALQKKIKLDISEKNAKEDIVEQEGLRFNKGKRPVLRELYSRPGLGQKKIKGILQCHLNGFRYTTTKGETIDVTFSNIKYAFFQPCEKQIIGAIHFRLHTPILIGKKKSEDIQFYSEGGQNAEDIGGRGRFGQDDDDEEKQKQSRRKLDRQFLAWMKSCNEFKGKHFEFQIPDRDGGFSGNPFNSTTLLQPTKNCLINIVDSRFFIAPLEDVEVVCFERMYANVRYFDMILILKDYQNFMKISQIPMKDVEKVKDWLDSCNLIFYDQGKNMNWIKFLGVIRKDFKKFVDDKGWMAWDEADQEQQLHDIDNDESFEAKSSELSGQSEDSQSSSGFENQNSSDSSDEGEELSEQGLSSSQLDERADMQDKQRDRREIQRKKQHEMKQHKKRR